MGVVLAAVEPRKERGFVRLENLRALEPLVLWFEGARSFRLGDRKSRELLEPGATY
jgi:hypothetical protein